MSIALFQSDRGSETDWSVLHLPYSDIIGYYAVGLPVGYYLAFRYGLGLEGLWAGQAVALLLVASTELAFYFLQMSWINEVKRSEDRGEEHS